MLRARIDSGAAERLGLVWVKNKGYPWWPARMVPAAYLGKVNPACKRPSGKDAELCQAYQYFGTLEYQWIPEVRAVPRADLRGGVGAGALGVVEAEAADGGHRPGVLAAHHAGDHAPGLL